LPVDSSCTHAIATTPAGPVETCRSCRSTSGGLPRRSGRSAPALRVSRSARRSLTLWSACWLTPQGSLFRECFSPIRYLLEPLQVLPVGATSYRTGFAPARNDMPFHGTLTQARNREWAARVGGGDLSRLASTASTLRTMPPAAANGARRSVGGRYDRRRLVGRLTVGDSSCGTWATAARRLFLRTGWGRHRLRVGHAGRRFGFTD